jgi:hypothetical protein
LALALLIRLRENTACFSDMRYFVSSSREDTEMSKRSTPSRKSSGLQVIVLAESAGGGARVEASTRRLRLRFSGCRCSSRRRRWSDRGRWWEQLEATRELRVKL